MSVAAIGGTEQTMAHVADGGYEMVGTFNGNPLAMAATRAMLTEVATPEAYQHIERLAPARRRRASSRPSHDNGLAAHVVTAGAKGCVVFAADTGHATTAASSASTTGTATRTGSSSTTAGFSCRLGARSSSG